MTNSKISEKTRRQLRQLLKEARDGLPSPFKEVAALLESPVSLHEVAAVTGVGPALLQNWLARGELGMEGQNPGRGRRRDFSRYDIAQLVLIKKLSDLSFPLMPAFKICAALPELRDSSPDSSPGGFEMLVDGAIHNYLFIVTGEEWEVLSRRGGRFPLNHKIAAVGDYTIVWAIWAKAGETPVDLFAAIAWFNLAAVIMVDFGTLLRESSARLIWNRHLLLDLPN